MTEGELLAAIFKEAGASYCDSDGAGVTHLEGRFDLDRIAEAFLVATHRREERRILDREDTSPDALAAEIRQILAPVR